MVVFGHGEAETVPAGALERGPPGVGVLEGAPYASGAGFSDLIYPISGGEGDFRPGAVPYRDRGGGGFPVLEAAVASEMSAPRSKLARNHTTSDSHGVRGSRVVVRCSGSSDRFLVGRRRTGT